MVETNHDDFSRSFWCYWYYIGTIALFIRLLTIKNFDRKYLTPFIPFIKSELKDSFIKTDNEGEKYRNRALTHNVKRGHFR